MSAAAGCSAPLVCPRTFWNKNRNHIFVWCSLWYVWNELIRGAGCFSAGTKALSQLIIFIYLFIYLFIYKFSKQNEASQIQNYNNPSLNVKTVQYTKLQFEQNLIILFIDWSNREPSVFIQNIYYLQNFHTKAFLYKICLQSKHAAFDWKIQRLTKGHQQ